MLECCSLARGHVTPRRFRAGFGKRLRLQDGLERERRHCVWIPQARYIFCVDIIPTPKGGGTCLNVSYIFCNFGLKKCKLHFLRDTLKNVNYIF